VLIIGTTLPTGRAESYQRANRCVLEEGEGI
jgi:hypothetical protein